MQHHTIQPKTSRRQARRIGRGGKRGTFSGRGTKGQRARAGHRIRPELRDTLQKIPKLRGYKFRSFRPKPAAINIGALARHFKDGDTISPDILVARGLARRVKGRTPEVKILGVGTAKKFVFKNVVFSRSAAEKVKALSKE
ncbi:MAG: uL15 family ribosomal protein [Patescibacteria group bacterium]